MCCQQRKVKLYFLLNESTAGRRLLSQQSWLVRVRSNPPVNATRFCRLTPIDLAGKQSITCIDKRYAGSHNELHKRNVTTDETVMTNKDYTQRAPLFTNMKHDVIKASFASVRHV